MILQTIELIVSSRIEEISAPRIKSIISLASDEMTRSKVKLCYFFIFKRRKHTLDHLVLDKVAQLLLSVSSNLQSHPDI